MKSETPAGRLILLFEASGLDTDEKDQPMRKVLLYISALLFLCLVGYSCQAGPDRSVAGKKVICFGWDSADATEFAEHARQLQGTGLDGTTINFSRRNVGPNPGGQDAVYEMRYYWVHWQAIKRKDIQHNIDALKTVKFGRLKHNFLSMYPSANATYVSPAQFFIWDKEKYDTTKFKPFRPNTPGEPQSWPEDPYQYFNAFKHNMVMAARICRELGLAGFLIDQETYDADGLGQMYHPWPMEVFGEDLETIRARVRKNVAEVFRAVCEEYPEIQILLIPGGRYVQTYEHNDGLVPAFTDGILMGLGPKASLYDGQEKAYYVGSLHKRFAALKQKTRQAGLKYSAVPDLYRERMKYSFGLWLDCRSKGYGGWHDDPRLNHFTGWDFGNALHYALYESDGYVWIYNEKAIMWPAPWRKDKKPNVNEAYFDAIRNCKKPRPLDLPRDPRGADREPLPSPAASYKSKGDSFETAAPGMELIAELKDGWEILIDHEDISTKSLGIRYPGGEDKPDFNWQPIQVGEFWENQGHRYNGPAFYRVNFKVPEKYRGRKVYIVMGGVANQCHIHLNTWDWIYGVYQTSMPVGSAPLKFPAKGVKFGDEENSLRIEVRNHRGPGGIYKPVWLAVEKKS